MEAVCEFCGLVDKSRCRSSDEADDCPHAPVERRGPVIKTGPMAGLRRGHYGAIMADPPWTFTTRSNKGKDRSPEQHYDCMTLDQIKALPVLDLAAKDCVLFLWAIDTHLDQALDLIRAWGFTYKTKAFTWAKLNKLPADRSETPQVTDPGAFFTGMGFWTRANPEDCLLATRGSPKRLDMGVRRLLIEERREHSRKPEAAYAGAERLVAGPRLEMFSRKDREGWDTWGHEKGKFDDPVQKAQRRAAAIENLV